MNNQYTRTEQCGYIVFNGMRCKDCKHFGACPGHASQKHFATKEVEK